MVVLTMFRFLTCLCLSVCTTTACGGRASTEPSPIGSESNTSTSTGDEAPDPAESKEAFQSAAEPLIEDYCTATTECYEGSDYADYDSNYSADECQDYLTYSLNNYFSTNKPHCRTALIKLLECYTDDFNCDYDIRYRACKAETNRLYELECYYYDIDDGYDSSSIDIGDHDSPSFEVDGGRDYDSSDDYDVAVGGAASTLER